MTLRRSLFALALGVFALTLASMPTDLHADIRIDITSGHVKPLPVAITEFHGKADADRTIGIDVARVVGADLERSGLFRLVDPDAFLETPEQIRLQIQPKFQAWRAINAQILVSGQAETLDNGRLRIEFRLWDITVGAQMAGFAYTTEPGNWRRVAHIVADAIYERITGEKGYFDTRIVFIEEAGPLKKRVKKLAIMDQDGANVRYLTRGHELVLTPRFSPTSQEITYLSYFNNKPRVYLLNIKTGRQESLGSFEGMTFAPRFTADGQSVLMSHARNGNTDIWRMDLGTRKTVRLTNDSAIDTSPSASPDGDSIVFNSDRGGSPQLYVMDWDGDGVRRISFGRGRYSTPVWSPRGDLVAFTKQHRGRFHIGVMRPDGSGERLLTGSFLDEAPTWAPNGRVLMFFRQSPSKKGDGGGESRLVSVDLTGFNLRRVTTPTDASDPAWSSSPR